MNILATLFIAYFSWKWWNSIIEIYYDFNKIFVCFIFWNNRDAYLRSLFYIIWYQLWYYQNITITLVILIDSEFTVIYHFLFEWKFADLMLVSFLQCKMCASKVSSIEARPIGIRHAVCPGLLQLLLYLQCLSIHTAVIHTSRVFSSEFHEIISYSYSTEHLWTVIFYA